MVAEGVTCWPPRERTPSILGRFHLDQLIMATHPPSSSMLQRNRNKHISSMDVFICLLVVILLSFTPSLAYSSSSSALSNNANASFKICRNIDIKNHPSVLEKLRDCTIIEGFLMIDLMDNENLTSKDYFPYTFPLLREVTDYVLIYRLRGLDSIGRLFPNLSVIRGEETIAGYSLVVYEMMHLREIGLSSLTTILKGAVWIDNNPNLCYADFVDWNRITKNPGIPNFIDTKKRKKHCQPCQEDLNCQQMYVTKSVSQVTAENRQNQPVRFGDIYNRLCWNQTTCQRPICPHQCTMLEQTCPADPNAAATSCCDASCIGGCTGPTDKDCVACKYYKAPQTKSPKSIQPYCTARRACPRGTFSYKNWRCILESECYNYGHKMVNGQCVKTCPSGYEESKQPSKAHTCVKCDGKCKKSCESGSIKAVNEITQFKDCTTINGNLEFLLSGNIHNLMEKLEENFKDVTEIVGNLKVTRSHQIKSLAFFRNLTRIMGATADMTIGKFKDYALIVQDNKNIASLFDPTHLTDRKKLLINGKVFIHSNPQLCQKEILALQNYSTVGAWDEKDVSLYTNGDRAACDIVPLEISLFYSGPREVVIMYEDFREKMRDPRDLLSYRIYYREIKTLDENVTLSDDREICGQDQGWSIVEVDPTEKTNDTDDAGEWTVISLLKPYTNYTIYVDTLVIPSKSPETASTARGRSERKTFTTKSWISSPPADVRVNLPALRELLIEWDSPLEPHGPIQFYEIEIKQEIEQFDNSADQDYCVREPAFPTITSNDNIADNETNVQQTASTSSPGPVIGDDEECCSCSGNSARQKTPSHNEELAERIRTVDDYVTNLIYVINPKSRNDSDITPTFSKAIEEINRRRRDVSEQLAGLLSKRQARSVSGDNIINPIHADVVATPPSVSSPTASTISIAIPAVEIQSTTPSFNVTSDPETHPPTPTRPPLQNIRKEVYNGDKFFIAKNLSHFTGYSIYVRACRDEIIDETRKSNCSRDAITSIRTLPLPGADDINQTTIRVERDNSTQNIILVKWDPPSNPNGGIASYSLEYKRVLSDGTTGDPHKYCLNKTSYMKYGGTILKDLPAGNYSVRLQAVSFAQKSNWSEPFYVYIHGQHETLSVGLIICLILLSITVLIVLILVGFWVKRKPLEVDYASINPLYISENFYKADGWEVDVEKVKLLDKLGSGSFGVTYLGEVTGLYPDHPDEVTSCAVKKPNENSHLTEIRDFLHEGHLMKSLDSPHVVKLMGIVPKRPYYVLMELMPKGDLRTYLRENRPDSETNANPSPPSIKRCIQFALEIADGMAYITEKKFIHGDLAARNCLLTQDLIVKISDFGMARDVYTTNYYRKGGGKMMPVRWMSPEALQDGLLTAQSDVWSYGIVLWEIVTLACQPYQGLDNGGVVEFVKRGRIMEKPESCPENIWEVMSTCWAFKPSKRPSFIQIIETFIDYASDEFKARSFYFSQLPTLLEAANNNANQKQHDSESGNGSFHESTSEPDERDKFLPDESGDHGSSDSPASTYKASPQEQSVNFLNPVTVMTYEPSKPTMQTNSRFYSSKTTGLKDAPSVPLPPTEKLTLSSSSPSPLESRVIYRENSTPSVQIDIEAGLESKISSTSNRSPSSFSYTLPVESRPQKQVENDDDDDTESHETEGSVPLLVVTPRPVTSTGNVSNSRFTNHDTNHHYHRQNNQHNGASSSLSSHSSSNATNETPKDSKATPSNNKLMSSKPTNGMKGSLDSIDDPHDDNHDPIQNGEADHSPTLAGDAMKLSQSASDQNDGSKGSRVSGKSGTSNGSLANGHLAHHSFQTTAC